MTPYLDEAQLEIATVDYFRELGYEYLHGPKIAPDREAPEHVDYGQVVLVGRLREALASTLLTGEIELPTAESIAEEVGA